MKLPEIQILRDTREKPGEGWVWSAEDKQAGKIRMLGTIETTLDAGDYSLLGFEDIVRIERKFGFAELFGNMTPKEHKERFEREMDKLSKIPHKYIVVESNVSKDIMSLSIPQFHRSPPVSVITKWLFEIQLRYGVIPVFAGDAGKKIARQIFENVVRLYG
jgi:hypothetical protein